MLIWSIPIEGFKMKPELTVSEIIFALPNLKPTDRRAISEAITRLADDNEPSRGQFEAMQTPIETALLNALMTELAYKGIRNIFSYEDFKKTTHYKNFRKALKEVEAFFEKAFPSRRFKKVEMTSLLRMLISALMENLDEQNIPLTFGTVTSNLIRLPEIFEKCFPGYMQCGLAHLVLKQAKKRT